MNDTVKFDPKPAARRLAAAWKQGTLIDRLPDNEVPRDIAAGYAIQSEVQALLDEPIGGYKLGMSSVAAMRNTGIGRPARGFMQRARIHASGARLALPPQGKFLFELEVCFVLGERTPAGAPVAEKLASVARAHLGIEMIAARLADRSVHGLPGLLGDDIGFSAYILGPEIPRADWPTLFGAQATISHGGTVFCANATGEARTDPAEALSMFIDDAAAIGLPLAPGMVITTGSLVVAGESAATGTFTGNLGPLSVTCTVSP